MSVTRLQLVNFRSYSEAEFKLHPGVTIVVGPNASGKTNLLESLYVLSTTRSFRAPDVDLISEGSNYFRISAQAGDNELAIGLLTDNGKHKQVTHNNVKRSLARHLGTLPVVLFEPTDLDLVTGPPDIRRRYLDLILSQTDAHYLLALHRYRRVLKQRNTLLDSFDIEAVRGQIFAWDLKLAELATQIYDARQQLVEVLNQNLTSSYQSIAGQAPDIRVEYLASVDSDDYHNSFLEALARNLPRDLGAGFTTIGPHREDFAIHFGTGDMESTASRGEMRTAVLAFKLAELNYQAELTGLSPLFLLDDVFSELDSQRRSRLVHHLGGYQTVITTTDADAVLQAITQPHAIIRTKRPGEAKASTSKSRKTNARS